MNKTKVIGIAGGSASGKSTFAKKLQEKLQEELQSIKCRIFSMDSYFLPPEERNTVVAPITGLPYRDDNHPSSFDLQKLKLDLKEATDAKECDCIIIEGLLTLWDEEICNMLTLKLFIDCRADERIVRRIRRNMGWGLSYDEIANVYLDVVRYRHDEFVEPTKWKADLILNGSRASDLALDLIVKHIKE